MGIFVLSGILTLVGSPVSAQFPDGSNTRAIEETTVANGETATDFLDIVYFGDEESERDRVNVTDAPVTEGGLGTPARAIEPGDGELSVELTCDPDETTLLTARLWPNEQDALQVQFSVADESFDTNARIGDPDFPGRFIYLTVKIPDALTEGKETVTVDLTAGNDSPDYVYSLYTHVENFYAPPAEESQGSPLEAGDPPQGGPDFDQWKEALIAKVDDQIDSRKESQMYGEDYTGDPKYYGLWSKGKDRRLGQKVALYLKAYKRDYSRHSGDEELIDRALAGMDGACRFQGYRGTLEVFYGKGGWIGGPDRSGIGGGLPGFLGKHLGQAIMEFKDIFDERPELLEKKIDNNGDGEATVTRREAYTQLFRDYLWENMLVRHALASKVYNQKTVNALSMLYANEALGYLSPEDVVPGDIILEIVRASVGLLPLDDRVVDFVLELQTRNDGEYGHAPGTIEEGRYYESKVFHWSASRHDHAVTPKGIGLELGYDNIYSWFNSWEQMADLSDDHQVHQRWLQYIDAIENFVYPTACLNGNLWSRPGAIGSRNPGVPMQSVDMWDMAFASVDTDHPAPQRFMRVWLNNYEGGAHGVAKAWKLLQYIPEIKEWYENEEPLDYRLPAERDEPYAWIDEMAGVAMIHDGDGTYYKEGWTEPSATFRVIS